MGKGNLVGALAAQVFVGEAFAAQLAVSQGLKAVALVRLQHIALQHGVVRIALHGNTVVGEDVAVVFDVLAELQAAGVLQPRCEPGEHFFQGQLLGCIHAGVPQRDVASLKRFVAEAEANDARLHVGERVGLGVQRHQVGCLQARQPGIKALPGGDGFVMLFLQGGRRGRGHVIQAGLHRGGCRHGLALQLTLPGLEAVLSEEGQQPFVVDRRVSQTFDRGPGLQVLGEVAVALHRHQLPPHGQPVQRLSKVLTRNTLDAAGGGHHAVERAVLANPLGGGFRADLLDTGHVVHGVAHQGQVVHDAVGRHAKLGQHAHGVQALVAHGVDEADFVGHQLRQVLVAGGDDDVVPRFGCYLGQGANGVIGLNARHRENRPAEQANHLVNERNLRTQLVGHGRALGFVLGVPSVAEGGAGGIEHTGGMGARKAVAQLLEHGHHAMHGASGLAFGPAQVGHGMKGAVEVAAAIDKQQGGIRVGHGPDSQLPKGRPPRIEP